MSEPVGVVVFAGGGTGGHLTPGLAVADHLRRQGCTKRVVFLGSQRPLEKRLLEQAGVEHVALPAESLTSPRRLPVVLWRSGRAVLLARRELRRLKPHVVVGLGGFASFPAALAACWLGVPLVLLEQNVVPGRVTRWLSRKAQAVCVSCQEVAARLPPGTPVRVTGNPVRPAVLDAARRRQRLGEPSVPTLLVVGGSQGAAALNAAVPLAVERLVGSGSKATRRPLRVVHQTGPQGHDLVRQAYRRLQVPATLAPFFDDLPSRLADATVVVTRAGATTLAEVACVGVPAIVVPYPFATDQHQRENARRLARAGAVRVVEQPPDVLEDEKAQRQFTARLAEALAALLDDAELRGQASRALLRLARPDAAARVAEVVRKAAQTAPTPDTPGN